MPGAPASAATVNALQTISMPRLPRVAGEVSFREDAINPRLARFARILLDLGVITEADAPRAGTVNEQSLLELALRRWSEKVIGRPLQAFDGVYLVVGADNAEELHQAYYFHGVDAPEVNPEKCVMVSLSPWERGDVWLLERRCLELRKRVPKLAEMALHLLDYGAGRSVPVMTPYRASDILENFLGWGGDEEDGKARSIFTSKVPGWVSQPTRRLTENQLRSLAAREPIATTCVELLNAISDRKRLSPEVGGFWHCVFAAVLRWSNDDLIARITDDYVQDTENSGEATSDYTWHFVELEREAVERFLGGFGRMLRTLELTDRLITQLADKAPPE